MSKVDSGVFKYQDIVLDRFDEVIELVKLSHNRNEANRLIAEHFNLTIEEASEVLDLPLGKEAIERGLYWVVD